MSASFFPSFVSAIPNITMCTVMNIHRLICVYFNIIAYISVWYTFGLMYQIGLGVLRTSSLEFYYTVLL